MKHFIFIIIMLVFLFNNCSEPEPITYTTEIIRNNQKLKVEVVCKSQYLEPRFTLKTGETREVQFNSEGSSYDALTQGGIDSVFIVFDDGKVKVDTNFYKKVKINFNEKKNILSSTYYSRKKIADKRYVIEYLIDSSDYQEAQ